MIKETHVLVYEVSFFNVLKSPKSYGSSLAPGVTREQKILAGTLGEFCMECGPNMIILQEKSTHAKHQVRE